MYKIPVQIGYINNWEHRLNELYSNALLVATSDRLVCKPKSKLSKNYVDIKTNLKKK